MSVVEAYVVAPQARPEAAWVAALRAEGYTMDGTPAERPTESLTLYRGAPPSRKTGISWTTDRAVAMRWATSEGQLNPVQRIWIIDECPSSALLAAWGGRHEAEVIVDTTGLKIRAWTMSEIKACPPMQRSAAHGATSPVRRVQLGDYQRSAKQGVRANHRRNNARR